MLLLFKLHKNLNFEQFVINKRRILTGPPLYKITLGCFCLSGRKLFTSKAAAESWADSLLVQVSSACLTFQTVSHRLLSVFPVGSASVQSSAFEKAHLLLFFLITAACARPQDLSIHHCCQRQFPLQRTQMAEQETVVTPPVGATGRRRQPSSDTGKPSRNTHTTSSGDTRGRVGQKTSTCFR